jgi:hypothetical protein
LELTRDARNVLTGRRQSRSATPPPPGTENESNNDNVVVKVVTNPSIPKPSPFEEDPHGFPMPNLTMIPEARICHEVASNDQKRTAVRAIYCPANISMNTKLQTIADVTPASHVILGTV